MCQCNAAFRLALFALLFAHLGLSSVATGEQRTPANCSSPSPIPSHHLPDSQRKLSRRKRYLIFPEGSSFQLVYDQIIPIVDYTNFLIFGVTTALAWPLPDKPIDDAKLRELYTNGTLIPFRRIDEAPPLQAADSEAAADELSARQPDPYYANRNPTPGYHGPTSSQVSAEQINHFYGSNDLYYAHNGLHRQLASYAPPGVGRRPSWPSSSTPWRRKGSAAVPVAAAATRRHHRIYPVLGKRSVRHARPDRVEHLDPHDRLETLHHRASRHALYTTIEHYLEAHGQPGGACVRRALCETARKRRETEPGSLVGELLRVVFSLPLVGAERNGAADRRRRTSGRAEDEYHEAFHGADGRGCAERFAECKQSVWESVFTL